MTVTAWAFYALGTPGPQGSKIRTRHGMYEASKKVVPWREAIKAAAPTVDRPLDGPLVVRMVFTLARPASARRTDVAPCKTPDLDKLARSTCDGISDSGLWASDARVVEFDRLAKVWWGYDDDALPVPGAVIACTERYGELVGSVGLGPLFADARDRAIRRIRGDAA